MFIAIHILSFIFMLTVLRMVIDSLILDLVHVLICMTSNRMFYIIVMCKRFKGIVLWDSMVITNMIAILMLVVQHNAHVSPNSNLAGYPIHLSCHRFTSWALIDSCCIIGMDNIQSLFSYLTAALFLFKLRQLLSVERISIYGMEIVTWMKMVWILDTVLGILLTCWTNFVNVCFRNFHNRRSFHSFFCVFNCSFSKLVVRPDGSTSKKTIHLGKNCYDGVQTCAYWSDCTTYNCVCRFRIVS